MTFNEYPYTDFHEMNLDWVIKKVKELAAAWAQVQHDWTDEQAAFANLQSWIENYFNNLNVQTEINVKLDAMVASGTMSELIAPYVASGLPAEVAAQIGDVVALQIGPVVAAQISAVVANQLPAVAAAAAAQEVSAWLALHVNPDTGYVIDDTFTVRGAAADAKAVGDEFTEIKSALSNFEGEVEDICFNETDTQVTLTVNGGYYKTNGTYQESTDQRNAILNATPFEKYLLTTSLRSPSVAAILYFIDDTIQSYEKIGTGNREDLVDYEFVVPNGINKVIVQNAVKNSNFGLKKVTYSNVSYTKEEADERFEPKREEDFSAKRYGLKWEIADTDDLGTRCFDSVGLTATIGVGSTDGTSDFDNIYPWSEIKRCNISKNANGAEIVTFEGEQDFALDGTNGDVFVRIPRFCYEKYQKDGFEYHVISESGLSVHPLFIEDGIVLDEVFIGAFEGSFDSNSKLRSIGGVLPKSNITPSEFLTAAKSNGNNYSLYDNRCVDAIWNLMCIEYGCRNTNRIIGYGIADFAQPSDQTHKLISAIATNTNTVRTPLWTSGQLNTLPVGSTITICDTDQGNILTQAKLTGVSVGADYVDWTFDGDGIDVDGDCFIGAGAFKTNWCEDVPSGALTWHTGRALWRTGDNEVKQNPVRYRWIENVVGNLWHFLPDVTFDGLQMYVCKSMKDYVFHKTTAPYMPENKVFLINKDNGNKSDGVGSNYWITTLDNGIFTKGIPFGRTYDKSLTSEKAFGAYYYLSDDIDTIANGGGFDHLWRCNVLTQRAWIGSSTKWYLYGARLMYKHLS